jgi:hypothetical protein
MEKDLEAFLSVLRRSSAQVGDEYFQLSQADGDEVYRERVYCYELYHQMRCRWRGSPYSLGGEVDKAGHPIFRDGPYGRSKPDFLVHQPGAMDRNLAIVEVKAGTASLAELNEDLAKLTWFCSSARYFAGILLIYGDGGGIHRTLGPLVDSLDRAHESILVFRHISPGTEATQIFPPLR